VYQQGQQKKNKMSKTFRRNKSGWDDDNQPSYKQSKKIKFSRREDKYQTKESEHEKRDENSIRDRKRSFS
jgi:hypothetical protein